MKQKKDHLNTRDFGHEIQELNFKLEHNQHFNALMLIIVIFVVVYSLILCLTKKLFKMTPANIHSSFLV